MLFYNAFAYNQKINIVLGFLMTDHISKEKRSWNMSCIRSKDTKPEKKVRSFLHRMGFRFSLRRKDLPGKPDVVLKKYKTVVFVHGCFWHQHPGCREASKPKTREEYWAEKLARNIARDKKNKIELKRLGWRVITIWECELERFPDKVLSILGTIRHY